jgi:hypothetical protein
MAKIYERPDSPYFHITYQDQSGKRRRAKTRYKKGDKREKQRALQLAATKSLEEIANKPTRYNSGKWEDWVLPWMTTRFGGGSPLTLKVYLGYFKNWMKFFWKEKIAHPCELTREHIDQYITWRTEPRRRYYAKKGLKYRSPLHGVLVSRSRNTAIQEIRFIRQVMNEAVEREYVTKNPTLNLRLKPVSPKKKALWSDHEIITVDAELDKRDKFGWMHVVFLFCLYQAMQFREIEMPLSCIDFETTKFLNGTECPWLGLITYPHVKGEDNKPFTQPIVPEFYPILKAIVAHRRSIGKSMLCDIPPRKELSSLEWRNLFDDLGFHHLVLHGLRATWITRAAKAGFPESFARKFVNHADATVHAIYEQITVDDLVPRLIGLALYRNLPILPEFSAMSLNDPLSSDSQTQNGTLALSNGECSNGKRALSRRVPSN